MTDLLSVIMYYNHTILMPRTFHLKINFIYFMHRKGYTKKRFVGFEVLTGVTSG
jgi:hypothetical protein